MYDIGVDDEIWDVEPIADPSGVKDDGYIAVGSADMGITGKDICIMRLNPDGSKYTVGVWGITNPIIVDAQASADVAYQVEQTTDGFLIICGSTATDHFNPMGNKNNNAWVGKLKLDGTWASGWNSGLYPGKEYGGTGNDIGYDIKQDNFGDYVIAGTANIGNFDVPPMVHVDGDYWVFKIPPNGNLNPAYSKVYSGDADAVGLDYARSLVIDCYTNYYVVSGFCTSCNSQPSINSQLLLVKIKPDFTTFTSEHYGNINAQFTWDYGSFNVIQTHDGTFNSCAGINDGFLSLGIQHPEFFYGCWGGTHDFWAVKTLNNIANPNLSFTYQCVNANVGGSYGGRKNDKGFSSALTCGGYLLAGITESNKPAQPGCPSCEVSCNHYDCPPDVSSEDIWLVKIDPITNQFIWNESIGKIGNDGAYTIKRVYDGSYIVAGYTTNNFEKDFYFRKFELAQPCVAPGGLSILTAAVCAKVSWTVEPCVWKYKLEYQEDNGPWIAIDGAISPFTITDNTVAGTGYFKWRVTSYCSPNKFTTIYGSPFSISYCNGCTCPLRVGNESDASEYGNNFLSVYPNPS
ncbi:MAG: hypothetical protein ABIQ74_02890, partial [Chitinophagales bacterium]